MKSRSYTFVIFALAVLFVGCDIIVPQAKTENLNGRVAVVKSVKYRASEKFGKPEKGNPAGGQHAAWEGDMFNALIEFDRQGQRSTFTRFDKQQNIISKEVFNGPETAVYNGYGNLIGKVIKEAGDRPAEASVRNPAGRQEALIAFEYDERGNTITENIYDETGALSIFRKFAYDKNDHISKQTEGRITVTRGTRISHGTRRDTAVAEFRFQRDGLGNPVEIKASMNKEKETFTFEYTFDEKQNWVNCVRRKNGRIDAIYERSIQYYVD